MSRRKNSAQQGGARARTASFSSTVKKKSARREI
jgi:hypothetical protein